MNYIKVIPIIIINKLSFTFDFFWFLSPFCAVRAVFLFAFLRFTLTVTLTEYSCTDLILSITGCDARFLLVRQQTQNNLSIVLSSVHRGHFQNPDETDDCTDSMCPTHTFKHTTQKIQKNSNFLPPRGVVCLR